MGSHGCAGVQGHGGIEKQEKNRVEWSRRTCFGTHDQGDKKQEVGRDAWW